MDIKIVIICAVIIILLYIAVMATIAVISIAKMKTNMTSIMYNSIKSYIGLRVLCKLDAKLDLDDFCKEYCDAFDKQFNHTKEGD